jgi:hypothetical protein
MGGSLYKAYPYTFLLNAGNGKPINEFVSWPRDPTANMRLRSLKCSSVRVNRDHHPEP